MFKDSNTSEDYLMDPKNVYLPNPKKLYLYKTSGYRWLIVVLLVLFYVTNYFCYMLPASLQKQYYTLLCDESLTKYNWIQSIYSFPNIILPLFGGIIVQYISMSFGMAIFSFLLLLGQFIQFIPYIYDSSPSEKYAWLLVGRAVFGMGGENMCITINSFVSKWFNGQEQSLALSIIVSAAGTGMILSGFTSNPIYEINSEDPLYWPQLIAVFVMFVGFILILIVYYIDVTAEDYDSRALQGINHEELTAAQRPLEKPVLDKNPFKTLLQLKEFSWFYWVCCLSMIVMYGQLIPFQNNLQQILNFKYGVPLNVASDIFVMPLIIQLMICPLGGILVDKYGKRGEVNILSCVMMVLQFSLWAFWECPGGDCSSAAYWIPLVIYGIGNSTYNNFIYPAVALCIEEKYYGTAFGLLDCIQQIGLAVFPLIASGIFDATSGGDNNYFWFFIFFGELGALGTLLSFYILYYDKKHGNILDHKETDDVVTKTKLKASQRQSFRR